MRSSEIAIGILLAATVGCGKVTSDETTPDAGERADASIVVDAGIKPFSGQIVISTPSPTDSLQRGVINVAFAKSSSSACAITTSATCTLTDCSNVPFTGPPAGFSAGPISVSGGHLSTTLLVQYNAGLQNYSDQLPIDAIQTGDQFEIHAPGADVSSFQGASANVPADITLTSPVAPDGGTLALDESQDLVVAWAGASAGSTTNVLISTDGAQGQKQIECTFDGPSGSGTVPSSLLESFGASFSAFAEIRVQPRGITMLQSDNASITLIVAAIGNGNVDFTAP